MQTILKLVRSTNRGLQVGSVEGELRTSFEVEVCDGEQNIKLLFFYVILTIFVHIYFVNFHEFLLLRERIIRHEVDVVHFCSFANPCMYT